MEAITGKPYKPTTQGKNERFHQTLFRYLDKQPIAESLAELQAHVDAFDQIYNTERPHQGLPGRHPADRVGSDPEGRSTPPQTRPATVRQPAPKHTAPHATGPTRRNRVETLNTAGTFLLAGVRYKVDGALAFAHSWSSLTATTSPWPTSTAKSSLNTRAPHPG